jgi:hypothetical protein
MFGRITTIKDANNAVDPMVISDSSDSDSIHQHDVGPCKRKKYAGPRTPPLHVLASPNTPACLFRHQNPSPDARPTEFSTPEKVEIQITDESLVSVPSFTPKDPSTAKVEIETTSPNPDHPCHPKLRGDEDTPDSDNSGAPALLSPRNVPPTTPRRESHVGQQNRLMFQSLHYIFGQTHPPYEEARAAAEESEDSDWAAEDDGEEPGTSTKAAPSGTPNEPQLPKWNDRGEHPGLGWLLNDSLSTDYHKMVIPDPTVAHRRLLIAPYVSYSILPDHAEVSATYGRGYPITTRTLAPEPVTYYCPPAPPTELSLLTEHPFADAVTKVVDNHFPVALKAALKQYQHYQEEKYLAQAKAVRLERRLERAHNQEDKALEKAMCVMSAMERANFMGRLFAEEESVIHELTAYPRNSDHFIRTALEFRGTVTQSALDPEPNLWRTRAPDFELQREAPYVPSHLVSKCVADNHKTCTHRLDKGTYETLAEEAIKLREDAAEIEARLADDDVRGNNRRRIAPIVPAFAKKRCFNCGKHGHIRQHCPHNRRPWHARK